MSLRAQVPRVLELELCLRGRRVAPHGPQEHRRLQWLRLHFGNHMISKSLNAHKFSNSLRRAVTQLLSLCKLYLFFYSGVSLLFLFLRCLLNSLSLSRVHHTTITT